MRTSPGERESMLREDNRRLREQNEALDREWKQMYQVKEDLREQLETLEERLRQADELLTSYQDRDGDGRTGLEEQLEALRRELATVKDDRDGKGFLRDAAEAKIARLERELREASAPGLAATSKAGDLLPPDGGAFPEGNDGEAGAEDSSPARES